MKKKVIVVLLASVAATTAFISADASAANHGGGAGGGFHGGVGVGFHGAGGGGFHGGLSGFHGGGSLGGGSHGGFTGFRAGDRGFAGHASSHAFVGHGSASHGLELRGNRGPAGLNAREHFAAGHLHGLYAFDRGGFNRNAFGVGRGWDRWGDRFRTVGWDHWGWGWGGWAGPVFWPFVLGDIFSYAFWPSAYDDPFWAYGPDFLAGSIFSTGLYLGPNYGYAVPNGYDAGRTDPRDRAQIEAAADESCTGFAPGVNGLPVEQISGKIHPTDEQKSLLDDLAAAFGQANNVVKASCPGEVPLTPVGRLDAAQKRLEAIIEAVKTVRPPLAKFFGTLTDEQKREFASIAGSQQGQSARSSISAGGVALCGPLADKIANVPVQRIAQTVEPDAQQQQALDELNTVSERAFGEIKASCPAETAADPMARLDAVESRLGAMVDALATIRPKLEAFYASLSDEQKARFNTLHPPQHASFSTKEGSNGTAMKP